MDVNGTVQTTFKLSTPVFIEACCDTISSAIAAQLAGAHRIELCGAGDGGTTPSLGMVEAALAVLYVPLAVMIRPRAGDFVYDSAEIDVMLRDIEFARTAGANRVVVGALKEDGRINVEQMRSLMEAAGTLPVTFHRAFDTTPNASEALDALIELGVDSVLTSGHAKTAMDGARMLANFVNRAKGRIGILAGGGVRAGNVRALVEQSSVRNVHLRGTDATIVGALVAALK